MISINTFSTNVVHVDGQNTLRLPSIYKGDSQGPSVGRKIYFSEIIVRYDSNIKPALLLACMKLDEFRLCHLISLLGIEDYCFNKQSMYINFIIICLLLTVTMLKLSYTAALYYIKRYLCRRLYFGPETYLRILQNTQPKLTEHLCSYF